MAPEISVVIPTRNRRERLCACLESLARQTASPDIFEVVVVDGSTDGTEEMLAALSTPYALRVVTQPQSGQSAALNLGAESAQGRFILLLDDDMVASPGLVAAHLETQRREGPVAGIGVVARRIPPRRDRVARHRAEEWRARYESLARRPATLRDVYSGNLSLGRETYLEVGGFAVDVPIEQDTEFAYRLHEHGAAFVHVPDGVATKDNREDWRSIVRNEGQRGRMSLALYRRHPAILPWLPIGGRGEPGGAWLALRTLFFAAHVPPVVPAAVGGLVPGRRASRRWFRFVVNYAYWVGVRSVADRDTWRRLRRGVLILMYHGIGEHGERPSRYVVPVKRFERQMAWLRRRGYNVMALEECLRCRAEFRLPPSKSVVLTFDDGYRDNVAHARPLLERLGMPATIFLVSAAGERNTWSTTDGVAGRPLMSLDEARHALGGVLSFGAHTRTHPKLTDLPRAEAEQEVVGSKQDLESALGVPVAAFAYPYGKLNDGVRQAVAEVGFAGACSVDPGRNRPSTDAFALRRIEIRGTYGLPRFATTVWLGDLRLKRREGA